ncbi:flagellar basal body P-ring protein FlgI [Microvirga thermotolerans]|uniref:Flagellar P-ring protein n=1 Tax=Microvirga thermotolerans TaxID=2651334 RepID=A0A5P9JXU9_9HYPH|nr:flagellar basal body P-ring protein FlgI [Microvirga thermotolerans]QFU17682.1 flagellar basal body P-ring protein FlgI [Microvirga thermotolerans]
MKRLLTLLLVLLSPSLAQASTRIKDIASVQGVRDNQLIGYGLVMGLQGTGDTLRNSHFTEQSLQSMLDKMGVNVRDVPLRTRNVAAVAVTADLPPFIGAGSRIDVTVTSLGDATSLKGGTLLLTSLMGGDGQVYAVAQGPVAVSGFNAAGQAETLTQGVATAGRIPNGALIEREVPGAMREMSSLVLELKNPDYKTATLITDAINAYAIARYGKRVATPRDFRTVVLNKPRDIGTTRFIAELGDLRVQPDTPARVVVDQRTGTVVIGKNVQISTVAMTHGNLTVRVTETPLVSQPEPFGNGRTAVVPRTQITATEPDAHLAVIGGSDLQTLVKGLNQIGLKPTDIIAILQAVKTAGALQADLIVQ